MECASCRILQRRLLALCVHSTEAFAGVIGCNDNIVRIQFCTFNVIKSVTQKGNINQFVSYRKLVHIPKFTNGLWMFTLIMGRMHLPSLKTLSFTFLTVRLEAEAPAKSHNLQYHRHQRNLIIRCSEQFDGSCWYIPANEFGLFVAHTTWCWVTWSVRSSAITCFFFMEGRPAQCFPNFNIKCSQQFLRGASWPALRWVNLSCLFTTSQLASWCLYLPAAAAVGAAVLSLIHISEPTRPY